MQHGALAHLLSRAAHRHEIAKVRRGGPRLAPEEKELYNTKAALEGWVSNLWCAKSYRRHSPKPHKSPTTLVMDSNGRWLYCTCEWRNVRTRQEGWLTRGGAFRTCPEPSRGARALEGSSTPSGAIRRIARRLRASRAT